MGISLGWEDFFLRGTFFDLSRLSPKSFASVLVVVRNTYGEYELERV